MYDKIYKNMYLNLTDLQNLFMMLKKYISSHGKLLFIYLSYTPFRFYGNFFHR